MFVMPKTELRKPSLQKNVEPPEIPVSVKVTAPETQWPELQAFKAMVTSLSAGLSFCWYPVKVTAFAFPLPLLDQPTKLLVRVMFVAGGGGTGGGIVVDWEKKRAPLQLLVL